jgi:hypothetical protein
MATQPLKDTDAEFAQERLDEWRKRLREACDQFKADRALVRALESDENPEYQKWIEEDGTLRVSTGTTQDVARQFRRRVGNSGLHGASAEEVGLAWALADVTLTLPLIEEATLTYSRPRVVPQRDHFSEPVEPWNGDEFEGVEVAEVEIGKYADKIIFEFKHRVCFYCYGQRYLVEDVEPFAWIRKRRGEWRVPTSAERDLLETGVKREHESREELEARRDEWIAEIWGSQKESLEKSEPDSRFNRTNFPEGVPKSCAEDAFEAMLGRIDEEALRDEQREVSRKRMAFRRQLRRRAA